MWGNSTTDIDVRVLIHGLNLVKWENALGMFIPDDVVVKQTLTQNTFTLVFDEANSTEGAKDMVTLDEEGKQPFTTQTIELTPENLDEFVTEAFADVWFQWYDMTYVFTIQETTTDSDYPGMTVDTAVYTWTIKVTKASNGQLQKTETLTKTKTVDGQTTTTTTNLSMKNRLTSPQRMTALPREPSPSMYPTPLRPSGSATTARRSRPTPATPRTRWTKRPVRSKSARAMCWARSSR